MNSLTKSLSATLDPVMAIIVYSSDMRSEIYLEQRNIENGKMGAGRPLSKDCITKIIKTLSEDNEDLEIGYRGITPPNMLFTDTTTGRVKLIWYNPPMKRQMFFVKSLGIPNGEMFVPGMLYVADNDHLKVWAFKGRVPKDKLYIAPYFNTGDNSLCLGTAKARKPRNLTFIEAMEYWENMFWNSEFSHLLNGENTIDGNLAVVTKHCINTGEPFPVNLLKPSKYKLKDLLK